jgi:hypothetical protein
MIMQMFDMIYAALLIFLLSAIGILGVKKAPGAPLLVLLLIGTILWRIAAGKTLARPLKEMSLHTAADLDRQDQVCKRDPYFSCDPGDPGGMPTLESITRSCNVLVCTFEYTVQLLWCLTGA